MPRKAIPPTNPAILPGPDFLTDDHIARWADIIADGRARFPDDLQSPERERLMGSVQARLRDRLVRFIARAIAHRLHRRDSSELENSNYA